MRGEIIIFITLICILAIFLAIILIIVNFAFKNVILSPRKTKEEAFDLLTKRKVYNVNNYDKLSYKDVSIESFDNFKLEGYYFEKYKNSNKVVIIVHGYTANHYISLQFLDLYFNEGFNVLLIDSRSHGKSEGKYVTYGIKEVEDLRLWIKFLRDKKGNNLIIGLHGQSMGAATILMYGGKYNDIDFIIADCPYSSGKKILEYQFKAFAHIPPKPFYSLVNRVIERKCGFSMNDVSPMDAVKKMNIPILFIHGTSDKTIPYAMSEEMFNEKEGNELLLVENADHVECYSKDKKGYERAIHNFINKVIK